MLGTIPVGLLLFCCVGSQARNIGSDPYCYWQLLALRERSSRIIIAAFSWPAEPRLRLSMSLPVLEERTLVQTAALI